MVYRALADEIISFSKAAALLNTSVDNVKAQLQLVWLMKIIVNDTNIFIDMNSIGLLGLMCELEYEIHTVDFVAAEIINPEQKKSI